MIKDLNQRERESTPTILRVIGLLWGAMLAGVILLILLAPTIQYAGKQVFGQPIFLGLSGIALEILLFLLVSKVQVSERIVVAFSGLFFVAQIFLVSTYFFKTGWDVRTIIEAAEGLAKGDTSYEMIPPYLSQYPNNILLVWLFSKVFKFGIWIGLKEGYTYFLVLVLQCAISALTGLIVFRSIILLTDNKRVALITYALYLVLVGLSPWVSIPYSDSVGLLLPALLIWIYLQTPTKRKSQYLKWGAIGFLSYLGYMLKPTVLIVLIAMLMVELTSSTTRKKIKQFGRKLVIITAGIMIAVLITSIIKNDIGYEIDPERRFGIAHYLAMGLNEDTMGVWSEDDVEYSASFETNKDRDKADLELAKARAQEMGIRGVVTQYLKKTLTNLNDGTFAWTLEGNFFWIVYDRNDRLSETVRSFYYADGANRKIFMNVEQSIWLSVLLFAGTAYWIQPRKDISIYMLTLIGFVIYGMLFEARARYVYIFAPLFLVLAGCGADHIVQRIAPGALKQKT